MSILQRCVASCDSAPTTRWNSVIISKYRDLTTEPLRKPKNWLRSNIFKRTPPKPAVPHVAYAYPDFYGILRPRTRHVSSCEVNARSWDVRGDLTLNSVAQIHTSLTLLTSRDLAWRSGRLTRQQASQISAVAHISWNVTYVSSALQTLPVVSRNGGNAYWKTAPTDLFIQGVKGGTDQTSGGCSLC
jgi:hypothetical protein